MSSASSAEDSAAESQPPELEFSVQNSEESLTAYLAAIGGAIIGLLLTLLVLYIWNGGTLNFTNQNRLDALEASLTQVDRNVGALDHNLMKVNTDLNELQSEAGAIGQLRTNLADLDTNLADLDLVLSDQGLRVDDLDSAVAQLDVTRRNFDTFTAALAQALSDMGAVEGLPAPAQSNTSGEGTSTESAPATDASPVQSSAEQPEEAAPAAASETSAAEVNPEAAATESSEATSEADPANTTAVAEVQDPSIPMIVASEDIASDSILAYLFVDDNANGVMDEGEASLVGASLALMPVEGEREMMAETSDAGGLFENLESGEYTIVVEDALGYELSTSESTMVTVTDEGASGQIVYFPVSAEASE